MLHRKEEKESHLACLVSPAKKGKSPIPDTKLISKKRGATGRGQGRELKNHPIKELERRHIYRRRKGEGAKDPGRFVKSRKPPSFLIPVRE